MILINCVCVCVSVRSAVEQVDEALDSADELSLLAALRRPCLALRGLRADHGPWYLEELLAERQQKALVHTHTLCYLCIIMCCFYKISFT